MHSRPVRSVLDFVMHESVRASSVIARWRAVLVEIQEVGNFTFGGRKFHRSQEWPEAISRLDYLLQALSRILEIYLLAQDRRHSYAAEQGKSGVLDFKSASSTRWKFVTPHLVSRLLKRLKRLRPCKFRGIVCDDVGSPFPRKS